MATSKKEILPSPAQQAAKRKQDLINSIKVDIKKFLDKAVRRDKGKFIIDAVDTNPDGLPLSFSGTVTTEATKEAPSVTKPMSWNTRGQALDNNRGFDLVVKVSPKEFLK